MKHKEFKSIINKVPYLGTKNFRELKEAIEKRVKSKKVSNILETPLNELNCPHCNSIKFIKWGKRNDMQRYKCKSCNKTFNSLTQTPLARLRRKGHWLDYAKCLKEGLTIRKAARECGIHKNTSFRWRHRFLENSKLIKTKYLAGIIETGELIFKESFKGSRDQTLLKKAKQNIYMIYSIDRNNNIFDITNKKFNISTLNSEFLNLLDKNSLLISERLKLYDTFFISNNLKSEYVEHFNTNSIINIENLNSYRNKFHDWIFKHFKGVATKYLENYVSWFRYRNEFKRGIRPLTILYRAKQQEKYRHQPLKVTSMVL